MNKKHLQEELKRLEKAETKFFDKNMEKRLTGWHEQIEKYVPDNLNNTLNNAFCKAFELIFEKGTGIIEKTYNKEKKQQNYKINEYAADLRGNRAGVKKFGLLASRSQTINMAISAAEGIGMGVLGMGLPDIPVFLSVLLKSIYEIALNYGFEYDTEKEQIFILKIMKTALLYGEDLRYADADINHIIEEPQDYEKLGDKGQQIKDTSIALSEEMLYLKFIQGMPIVGMIGGVADVVYQKKITDYANLKYKRRFLIKHLGEEVVI